MNFASQPIELLQRPSGTSYILSRFSLAKVTGKLPNSISLQALSEALNAESTKTAYLDPRIVIVAPPPELIPTCQDVEEIWSQNSEWTSPIEGKYPLDIVIFCNGAPQHLPLRPVNRPIIAYSFDLLARYRSSIWWEHSGRPCPLCCINLFRYADGTSTKRLYKAAEKFEVSGVAATRGVRLPSLLELYAAIDDANRLANAIRHNDDYTSSMLTHAGRLDLSNGATDWDLLPVHPQCRHGEQDA